MASITVPEERAQVIPDRGQIEHFPRVIAVTPIP
jgi:hypothetical protein